MFLLLPPSEGKSAEPGLSSFAAACPEQVDPVAGVVKHLRKVKAAERPRIYGVSTAEKAKAAHALNQSALDAPVLPALERYTGVVYNHIGYPNLRNRTAAREHVLIVSALFGLIRGGTPLPDYKLSMNPWLARYWQPLNTTRLRALAGKRPVVNLLSQSYAKAVAGDGIMAVDFRVQGGRKAAGHFGKAIKGRFVRWIVENGIQSAADFSEFTEDGYRFDGTNFIQA